MSTTPQVYGVRDTLAALKDIEPKLKREAMKSIRDAARPMAAMIETQIPTSAPLRGMDNDGRLGWGRVSRKVTTKVGGRRSHSKDEWPLVSFALKSAPLQLFDMAGRKGRNHLDEMLTPKFGPASRAAWRTEEPFREQTQRAILEAIKEMSKTVNKDLVTRGTI